MPCLSFGIGSPPDASGRFGETPLTADPSRSLRSRSASDEELGMTTTPTMPDQDTADQPGPRRLGRNVYALAAVSFFTDVSSEMIYPLLPVFLTTILGASAGFIGAIEGA